MVSIRSVLQSRSVDGGHAIELDFVLDDETTHTIKMPYECIPQTMHAITNAASVAETAQRVGASGQPPAKQRSVIAISLSAPEARALACEPVLLDVRDMPQVGLLDRGRIKSSSEAERRARRQQEIVDAAVLRHIGVDELDRIALLDQRARFAGDLHVESGPQFPGKGQWVEAMGEIEAPRVKFHEDAWREPGDRADCTGQRHRLEALDIHFYEIDPRDWEGGDHLVDRDDGDFDRRPLLPGHLGVGHDVRAGAGRVQQ
jgi:hypothetical protein